MANKPPLSRKFPILKEQSTPSDAGTPTLGEGRRGARTSDSASKGLAGNRPTLSAARSSITLRKNGSVSGSNTGLSKPDTNANGPTNGVVKRPVSKSSNAPATAQAGQNPKSNWGNEVQENLISKLVNGVGPNEGHVGSNVEGPEVEDLPDLNMPSISSDSQDSIITSGNCHGEIIPADRDGHGNNIITVNFDSPSSFRGGMDDKDDLATLPIEPNGDLSNHSVKSQTAMFLKKQNVKRSNSVPFIKTVPPPQSSTPVLDLIKKRRRFCNPNCHGLHFCLQEIPEEMGEFQASPNLNFNTNSSNMNGHANEMKMSPGVAEKASPDMQEAFNCLLSIRNLANSSGICDLEVYRSMASLEAFILKVFSRPNCKK